MIHKTREEWAKLAGEQCPKCDGKGECSTVVAWSDGLGMSAEVCSLCDGKGTLQARAWVLLDNVKKERNEIKAELNQLKVSVALYLSTSNGELPNPPLKHAPNPSPYASTWLDYLKKAIANLPRV